MRRQAAALLIDLPTLHAKTIPSCILTA